MADKLLIADDEPDIVDTLARCFASRGYEIMRASSGEEAVRQAGRAPDLILLDVNMPDLDGLEVCRRIRGHVSCPIIFLTARVEEADKLRGFAAGGDDYVVKPFQPRELLARIRAALRGGLFLCKKRRRQAGTPLCTNAVRCKIKESTERERAV